jgi:hypothetical protein
MKINTTNYEECFLLYIDNELSDEQKVAVENFMEENPVYKKEFTLIQQSVLAPENILFEDKVFLYRLEELEASLHISIKQGLYREEAKLMEGFFNRKLIRSIAAVAALFLLIIGYNLIPTIPVKQNNLKGLSNNERVVKNDAQSYLSNTANSGHKQVEHMEDYKKKQNANVIIQDNDSSTHRLNTLISISTEKNNYAQQAGIIQSIATSSNHFVTNDNAIKTVPIINNTVAIATVNEKIVSSEVSVLAESKEEFENINTDNPDRIIYIANMEIDGDKLRGFTRRIGAFIKRNKTEKEK